MKKLFLLASFLAILSACAVGFGVRVHPGALQDLLLQKTKEYYRLDLLNGQTLTGECVAKNKTGIFFKSRGVSISFASSEIARLTPLGNRLPAEEMSYSRGRPWITFSLEDGLLRIFLPSSKENSSSLSKSLPFFDSFTPGMPLNMYAHAKSQLKKASEISGRSQNA